MPGELDVFDWDEFVRRSKRALGECGIERYLLSADASLNHWEGRRDESVFQLQLWGLLEEPRRVWREGLIEEINISGAITKPVFKFEPRCVKASLAYGVKSKFTRRVSFMREYPESLDREASRVSRSGRTVGKPVMQEPHAEGSPSFGRKLRRHPLEANGGRRLSRMRRLGAQLTY
jgi:hypothetical protein